MSRSNKLQTDGLSFSKRWDRQLFHLLNNYGKRMMYYSPENCKLITKEVFKIKNLETL